MITILKDKSFGAKIAKIQPALKNFLLWQVAGNQLGGQELIPFIIPLYYHFQSLLSLSFIPYVPFNFCYSTAFPPYYFVTGILFASILSIF